MSCLLLDFRCFLAGGLQLETLTCPPLFQSALLPGMGYSGRCEATLGFEATPCPFVRSSSPSVLSIHLLGGPSSKRCHRGMLPDTRFASSAQQLHRESLRSSVDPLMCPNNLQYSHWTQETQKQTPPCPALPGIPFSAKTSHFLPAGPLFPGAANTRELVWEVNLEPSTDPSTSAIAERILRIRWDYQSPGTQWL